MRINKYFFGLILSTFIASASYAVQINGHANRYDNLGDMPAYLQVAIMIWWVAAINIVIWLVASCIAFGRYLRQLNRNG